MGYQLPRVVTLHLPLPPSPNTWQEAHHMEASKQWNKVKRRMFMAAAECQRPFPCEVLKRVQWRADAEFRYTRPERDAIDNQPGSLKPVWDALKCAHPDHDRLIWRSPNPQTGAMYVNKGWIYDDAGQWLVRGDDWTARQCERKPSAGTLKLDRTMEGVTVTLTVAEIYR